MRALLTLACAATLLVAARGDIVDMGAYFILNGEERLGGGSVIIDKEPRVEEKVSIEVMKGGVSVQSRMEQRKVLKETAVLSPADRVFTEESAQARLLFRDGASCTVGEEAALRFEGGEGIENPALRLVKGVLRVSGGKRGLVVQAGAGRILIPAGTEADIFMSAGKVLIKPASGPDVRVETAVAVRHAGAGTNIMVSTKGVVRLKKEKREKPAP